MPNCSLTSAAGVELLAIFFSGLLAGALLIIHYGIRPVVSSLADGTQIQVRQSFIYRLRILIPALFLPTLVSTAFVAVLGCGEPGSQMRWAGVLVELASFLIALAGTAPINKAILSWRLGALPTDWRTQIQRWEKLDAPRTWGTVVAFVLMLSAIAVRFHQC